LEEITLEKAAENYGWRIKTNTFSDRVKANELADSAKQDFISGANWMEKRRYSDEDVLNIIFKFTNDFDLKKNIEITSEEQRIWFEQIKKK